MIDFKSNLQEKINLTSGVYDASLAKFSERMFKVYQDLYTVAKTVFSEDEIISFPLREIELSVDEIKKMRFLALLCAFDENTESRLIVRSLHESGQQDDADYRKTFSLFNHTNLDSETALTDHYSSPGLYYRLNFDVRDTEAITLKTLFKFTEEQVFNDYFYKAIDEVKKSDSYFIKGNDVDFDFQDFVNLMISLFSDYLIFLKHERPLKGLELHDSQLMKAETLFNTILKEILGDKNSMESSDFVKLYTKYIEMDALKDLKDLLNKTEEEVSKEQKKRNQVLMVMEANKKRVYEQLRVALSRWDKTISEIINNESLRMKSYSFFLGDVSYDLWDPSSYLRVYISQSFKTHTPLKIKISYKERLFSRDFHTEDKNEVKMKEFTDSSSALEFIKKTVSNYIEELAEYIGDEESELGQELVEYGTGLALIFKN